MMMEHGMTDQTASEQFWERRYRDASPATSKRPSTALARYAEGLAPGRALDLGCGKGDDTVWLARRGWEVLAVDVSAAALAIVEGNARAADVAGRVRVERHDLERSFPEGCFDLVSAMYLESPVAGFAQAAIMCRAADAVAPGGLLLAATHGSRSPWSNAPLGWTYPSPEEALAELDLDPEGWDQVFVGAPERQATGPGGQVAIVKDTILALKRRTQG